MGVHSGLTPSIPAAADGQVAGHIRKRFTLVFEGDIRAVRGPLFTTFEGLGKVVGVQSVDVFEQCLEVEDIRDRLADALRRLTACFPASGRTRVQMDALHQSQKALALTYDETGA